MKKEKPLSENIKLAKKKLRHGEITIQEYLDIEDVLRVDAAKKLKERLEFIMNNSDYHEDDFIEQIDKTLGFCTTKVSIKDNLPTEKEAGFTPIDDLKELLKKFQGEEE